MLTDRESKMIPVKRQAELLGIARSTIYYQSTVDPYSLKLMRLIDKVTPKLPFMALGE